MFIWMKKLMWLKKRLLNYFRYPKHKIYQIKNHNATKAFLILIKIVLFNLY